MVVYNYYYRFCLLACFISSVFVLSAPSLSQLNSDLTILSNNKFSNDQSEAVILMGAFTNLGTAEQSCISIGETLWASNFAVLNNSLSYPSYLGLYPSHQLFWIAPEKASSCRAINSNGHTSNVDCSQKLPTICTQSAPSSNSTFSSTAPQLQITQQVGNISLTGFRDRFAWKFFGIRFAPKPQRFTYSTDWDGTGDVSALSPGPACVQTGNVGSEDCLFLNIWTPFLPSSVPAPKKKLKAVMLWIFGGGNYEGSASDTGTDGTNLASRGDVVVVSINYRLGNLGFLALNDSITNGNYGIQDAITALRWISRYIEAFGGDPSRITVFGESAGASNVRALLASPMTKGLIAGAIMESTPVGIGANAFAGYSNYSTIQHEMDTVAIPILNMTGCLNSTDQLECLTSIDAYELSNLPVIANFPLLDGTYLTSSGLSFAKSSSQIPILLGTNRDEGGISAPYPADSNLSVALETLSSLIGIDVTYVASSPYFPAPKLPNSNSSLDNFNLTSRIITDGGLACLAHATAYSASLHSTFSSVYLYTFNRTYQSPTFTRPVCQPPMTPAHPNGDLNEEYYKCHSGEVNYVFGVLERLGLVDRDGFDTTFSRRIVDRWAAFARTGSPNPEEGFLNARGFVDESKKWERVSSEGGKGLRMMLLQLDEDMVEMGEKEQCQVLGLPLDYFEHATYTSRYQDGHF